MSIYVSGWCWQHSQASGGDLLVLLAIADQANDDGEDAWPSYATLAARCRVSEKTIQRATARLVKIGELSVERHGGPASQGATRQHPNRYSFPAYQARKGGPSDHPSPDKGGQDDSSSGEKPGQIDQASGGERVDTLGQRVDTAVSTYPSFNPSILKTSSEVAAGAAQATADAAAEGEPGKRAARPRSRPSKVEQEPRQDVERLCGALRDHMIANGCRPPAITQAWQDAARLMFDKDDRQIDEALDLLAWVAQDEFWRANILSLPKFRARYDQLRLRWQQTNPVRHLRSEEAITHWLRQQWRDGFSRAICERSGMRYRPPENMPDEIRTSVEANKWHAQQVRKWIEDNQAKIVSRIRERETPAEVAS